MKRNCLALQDKLFDLLVIGGGVHGAAAARRLAMAGYDVALVEKGDFCQATSANSLKILHGGLRYLQHADFKRMRESIRARREFMQFAPHLVQPLPCLMPTKGFGVHGNVAMGSALLLNDLISFDRNQGVPSDKHLGRGKIFSADKASELIPNLPEGSYSGAARWYDTLLLDSERMVIELLHQAANAGATLGNYLRVEAVAEEEGEQQTRVEDLVEQTHFTIRSKMVINCSGPWVDGFIGAGTGSAEKMALARAVNIVVDRQFFGKYAVGLEGSREYKDNDRVVQRGKRLFFFVPWRGKTMIGTSYRLDELTDTPPLSSKHDIGAMLEEINTLYPAAKLSMEDVTFSHVGLVPAFPAVEPEQTSDPRLLKHSEIVDQGKVLSIRGVKYTTALQVARELEELLRAKQFLPSSPAADVQTDNKQNAAPQQPLLHKQFPHLVLHYGPHTEAILQLLEEQPEHQQLISSDPPLTVAEVLYGVREEMALHLADVILRRTGLGSSFCPDPKALQKVAEVMGKELGWSEERSNEEVATTQTLYKSMNVRLP